MTKSFFFNNAVNFLYRVIPFSFVNYSLIELIPFCEKLVAAMQHWINGSMCIKIFYRTDGFREIELGQFVYYHTHRNTSLGKSGQFRIVHMTRIILYRNPLKDLVQT